MAPNCPATIPITWLPFFYGIPHGFPVSPDPFLLSPAELETREGEAARDGDEGGASELSWGRKHSRSPTGAGERGEEGRGTIRTEHRVCPLFFSWKINKINTSSRTRTKNFF